jgi:ZIP family zinc transporter
MTISFYQLLLAAAAVFGATALGAACVLVFQCGDRQLNGAVLGFCGGMMGYSAAEMVSHAGALAGLPAVWGGVLVGAAAVLAIARLLPHAHMVLRGTALPGAKRKVALLVATITIHNLPEGFAVASAFASSSGLGWLVTASIALQDVPEGLMVAAPVACYGVASRRSFLWGAFSGAVEAVAAVAGFALLGVVSSATPFALAFSGGAMGYVVVAELLPDAFRAGSGWASVVAFAAGVAIAIGGASVLTH